MKKYIGPVSFFFISFLLFFACPFSVFSGEKTLAKKDGDKKKTVAPLSSGEKKSVPPEAKKNIPREKKVSGKKKKSIPPPLQKFVRELSLVLESLQKHSPQTAEKLFLSFEKESLELLQTLLQNGDSGVKCLLTVPGQKKVLVKKNSPEQKKISFYSEKLCEDRLLYIVLPDLSRQNFEKYAVLLKENSSSCKGIIFDLRFCNSFKGHPELFLQSMQKRRDGLFIALLTGSGTCGDGEIFAASSSKFAKVILIGAPTKGQPFILRPLPLKLAHGEPGKNGKYQLKKLMQFLVPVIPEKWKDIPPKPVLPGIRTKISPVYKHGAAIPGQDPALRIASDLLLSLNVVKP